MAVNEGDSAIIDIDNLVSSIEVMVPRNIPLLPPKCCIFKTPSILKRHNKQAYIPDKFSIGPLHHGDPNLKAAEKIKAKYLQDLMSRSNTMLRTLISSVMDVENEARECYAEAIDYSPEQLVKILVVDGCFIIELLCKNKNENLREKDDPIFTMSCMFQYLFHDLILLENQLPWMVLVRLFNLTVTKDDSGEKSLILLAKDFLRDIFLPVTYPPDESVENIEGIMHLVDLNRKLSTFSTKKNKESCSNPAPVQSKNIKCIKYFVDPLNKKLSTLFAEKKKENPWTCFVLPPVTSLVEAGIKFKMGESSENVLDIKFTDDGVLEIPKLVIQKTTETVMRNLISFEQCYPNCEAKITSYIIFLDKLIDTAKDMDILCKNDIIFNWLNPEYAAQIFNMLYDDTLLKNFYYKDICKRVNRFCQRRWPRWRAVLVRNYFNTPWAVISTSAAIILLILTLLQTIYGIKK